MFNLGEFIVVYGEDNYWHSDEEAEGIRRNEPIKVSKAFCVFLVRVLKGCFVVENMSCDQQWQTDKQLSLPVGCSDKKYWKCGQENGILEQFGIYFIESSGLIAD